MGVLQVDSSVTAHAAKFRPGRPAKPQPAASLCWLFISRSAQAKMSRSAVALSCAAMGLAVVHGHGSMIQPPARNAIDVDTSPWSNAKHPSTGSIEPVSTV
jgi:hypothetical protein